ncbi:acyl-CoA dehydrogenase family protein [Nocardiopsis valliformis]|uniref:acyl-CoA dehydrogenase family protein n=1 Tax=Nocardiopsis valliformis TaxID=239974 RepID=UPI00034CDCE9|nr:acyl-CoA dehydrogenase family protein [Nocardiopsis valliformis]
MDFGVPESTEEFERRLVTALRSTETRDLIDEVSRRADGMDGDPNPLYRHLGRSGLLAPSWPRRYGGLDADPTATMVLLENMVRYSVPQSLYYISVQIVGSLILQAGTEEQRRELLPRLASGELTMCILFTEPDHGSDLAGITTRAVRDHDGSWVLNGRKTYNLKTAYADLALCAVCDGGEDNRYESITLFLVPLDNPGVSIRPIASLSDEQFHDVRLTDVKVGAESVFGEVGGGWGLITRMFTAERNGLDYYARARHWLEQVTEQLTRNGREPLPDELAGLARHRARLRASRLLCCRVLQGLSEDRVDIAQASLAKWHCSETAQGIAWWAVETLGADALEPAPHTFDAAFREAPGMTVSGGASEVQLDIVAGARLLDSVPTRR